MENTVPSELGESELLEYLQSENEVLTLVALARRQSQSDTAYDHFLYDYIGGIESYSPPTIERHYLQAGDCVYDQRLLASYSPEGSLVHVRTQKQIHPEYREQDFFVVTADLRQQTTTEWRISKAGFSGSGSSLRLELILSNQYIDELSSVDEHGHEVNPLQNILAAKRRKTEVAREAASQPHLLLTGQGCWFSPDGKELEELAPINELVRKVDAMYLRYGHIALLQSETTGASVADTIAA